MYFGNLYLMFESYCLFLGAMTHCFLHDEVMKHIASQITQRNILFTNFHALVFVHLRTCCKYCVKISCRSSNHRVGVSVNGL